MKKGAIFLIYAMADPHGEYEKYLAMLEKIRFDDDDTLFVLGDMLDRGPQPIALVCDMMRRSNVYAIMGNHEYMALSVLKRLTVEITRENVDTQLDPQLFRALVEWRKNGGDVTLAQFRALAREQQGDLLDYLSDLPCYDAAEVNDRTYLFVHAGLGNFARGKKLSQYKIGELLFMRPDMEKDCFDDKSIFIVCGHTPTLLLSGRAEIYRRGQYVDLDCGASFPGGRLACLCLDTMREYYV